MTNADTRKELQPNVPYRPQKKAYGLFLYLDIGRSAGVHFAQRREVLPQIHVLTAAAITTYLSSQILVFIYIGCMIYACRGHKTAAGRKRKRSVRHYDFPSTGAILYRPMLYAQSQSFPGTDYRHFFTRRVRMGLVDWLDILKVAPIWTRKSLFDSTENTAKTWSIYVQTLRSHTFYNFAVVAPKVRRAWKSKGLVPSSPAIGIST